MSDSWGEETLDDDPMMGGAATTAGVPPPPPPTLTWVTILPLNKINKNPSSSSSSSGGMMLQTMTGSRMEGLCADGSLLWRRDSHKIGGVSVGVAMWVKGEGKGDGERREGGVEEVSRSLPPPPPPPPPAAAAAHSTLLLFLGTTDGMLHIVDGCTGLPQGPSLMVGEGPIRNISLRIVPGQQTPLGDFSEIPAGPSYTIWIAALSCDGSLRQWELLRSSKPPATQSLHNFRARSFISTSVAPLLHAVGGRGLSDPDTAAEVLLTSLTLGLPPSLPSPMVTLQRASPLSGKIRYFWDSEAGAWCL